MEKSVQDKELSSRQLKNLKERKNKILTTLKDYRRKNTIDMVWFILWTSIFSVLVYLKSFIWTEIGLFRSIICHIFIIIAIIGALYKLFHLSKNKKTKIDSNFELSVIEDDIFLEEIKSLNYEEKALKQLSKKQIDIEKYHSLNIAHTKIIFIIGVFIIFIGIAIIAITIISIFFIPKSVQLITVASGFIGGMLVDAIGGIFILMYSKTLESAQEYQTNMVKTANTYLGNVLASQITNNELREQTLSIMSKELVQKGNHIK